MPVRPYVEATVGDIPLWYFLLYEFLISIIGPGARRRRPPAAPDPLPGGNGGIGRGLVLGRSVTNRHARGWRRDVDLDDEVIVNRNCALKARTVQIRVGAHTTAGQNSLVVTLAGIGIGKEILNP